MQNSLIAPLISLALIQSGCSSCDGASEGGAGGSSGLGGGGTNVGASSSTGGTSGTFSGTGGSGGGPTGCFSCSTDLHQVLDCEGNVLTTCGGEEGCGPTGTCVPACESAGANRSTFGCDFYSATPAVVNESRGSCFAAMVANTWDAPVSLQIGYGSETVDAGPYTYTLEGTSTYQPVGAGGKLAPGQLGVVFLSSYDSGDVFHVACPRPPWRTASTHIEGDGTNKTGLGNAFHLTTTAPIVAYDVFPWGGAASYVTSSTLLLPTPTWGNNFVTADGWEAYNGQPFTQIVAAENGTNVSFVPRSSLVGGSGLPSGAAGSSVTFTLDAGEIAQFAQDDRLSGSTLQANKPVSVWAGSTCMNIPSDAYACDAAHQQTLPVQSLGSEYVIARYPSRGGDDAAPVTFVGMVDGTALIAEPPVGVPGVLNKGDTAIVWTTEPFQVASQDPDHPFYVAAHMTGAALAAPNLNGDPEFVNVVPPAQYLPYYLFVTDPTYAYTALAFVRKKDESGAFQEVTLDCMGPITEWTPVGSAGQYESARFLIVDDFVPVGGCNNGVHTASSTAPFGLTVWGYDQTVSYAYPAGMSLEAINTVVIPTTPE